MSQAVDPSVRVRWNDVPLSLRAKAEKLCGARVVAVDAILEGFSPGLVAQLHLADGQSVFAKACPSDLNPRTPTMHSRESEILACAGVWPAPAYLGRLNGDGWDGLVTRFISAEARRWVVGDTVAWDRIERAFAVCDAIAVSDTAVLARHADQLASDFLWFGVTKLLERDGQIPLTPFGAGVLATPDETALLIELEAGLPWVTAGGKPVHGDLRADNVVLGVGGVDVAVDWPAAALGNPLFDAILLAGSIARDANASHLAPAIAEKSLIIAAADPDEINVMIAGFVGHYLWASSLGSPPGIPGVRSYQAELASVFRTWLAHRTQRKVL